MFYSIVLVSISTALVFMLWQSGANLITGQKTKISGAREQKSTDPDTDIDHKLQEVNIRSRDAVVASC